MNSSENYFPNPEEAKKPNGPEQAKAFKSLYLELSRHISQLGEEVRIRYAGGSLSFNTRKHLLMGIAGGEFTEDGKRLHPGRVTDPDGEVKKGIFTVLNELGVEKSGILAQFDIYEDPSGDDIHRYTLRTDNSVEHTRHVTEWDMNDPEDPQPTWHDNFVEWLGPEQIESLQRIVETVEAGYTEPSK